jgi:phage repressor protein C with HTH and peptisase S24 domain
MVNSHVPGADMLAKIAEAVGCSSRWLLTGEGDMFEAEAESQGIPVLGTASAAGKYRIAYAVREGEERVRLPGRLHLIVVTGDSMAPLAVNGQHVLCTDEIPQHGDLAVIEMEDGELLFKRVQFDGNRVHLVSVNPDPQYSLITIKKGAWRSIRKVWGVKF